MAEMTDCWGESVLASAPTADSEGGVCLVCSTKNDRIPISSDFLYILLVERIEEILS